MYALKDFFNRLQEFIGQFFISICRLKMGESSRFVHDYIPPMIVITAVVIPDVRGSGITI